MTDILTAIEVDDAREACLKAEREWSLCLADHFGEDHVGHMRETKEGEGIHGSDLNHCYLDYVATREHLRRLVQGN